MRSEPAERRPRPRRPAERPPGANMSRAEMGMMRRLPGASKNQTSQMQQAGTSRKNWRRFGAKWSRMMRNPFRPFKLYVTKHRFSFI